MRINGDPIPWLLEADPDHPGVRYFALTDLLDRPEEDTEVLAARGAVMQTGPVPVILAAKEPEGIGSSPGRAITQSTAALSGRSSFSPNWARMAAIPKYAPAVSISWSERVRLMGD